MLSKSSLPGVHQPGRRESALLPVQRRPIPTWPQRCQTLGPCIGGCSTRATFVNIEIYLTQINTPYLYLFPQLPSPYSYLQPSSLLTKATPQVFLKVFLQKVQSRQKRMGSHEDFLAISSLSELYENDPIGECGCKKSGDKASIHDNEEPTRWDVRPALQLSDQNLRGNLPKVQTELFGFSDVSDCNKIIWDECITGHQSIIIWGQ